MYRKIDHLGIAVRSLNQTLSVYESALGLVKTAVKEVEDQKTRVAQLPVGDCCLELLEAMDEDSAVARFLAKRGEGLHHICFEVDDIYIELNKLKAAGIRLIDETPRRGVDGCLVAFVHPSATAGVLIELSQKAFGTNNSISE
jgi:methylmalonyl-CoA/ethylmalonyl-CoA epimerase